MLRISSVHLEVFFSQSDISIKAMKKLYVTLLFLHAVSIVAFGSEKALECTQPLKDYLGKEICIPDTIDKIVITCYGGASQEITLFNNAHLIAAQPSVSHFPQFLRLFPTLKEIPSVGSFSDVNIEELIKINPSIVFVGATSLRTNENIAEIGFSVYTLGIGRHDISSLLEELLHLGSIFHEEQKAQMLVDYWQKSLSMITQRIKNVEPKDKKRILYGVGSGKSNLETKRNWNDEFIEAAGGINVTAEVLSKGETSLESLIVWNPDVIITTRSPSNKNNAEALRKNSALQHINAVRTHQVYEGPVGTSWWDRPSPESILGIIWLAKILYPEETADIDLKQETLYFYATFYGYRLSDEEYVDFFEKSRE